MAKREKLLPPIHPGEILRADFMEPFGLSMNRLALDLRVPVTRIAEIVHERRGILPIRHCAWLATSIPPQAFGSIFSPLTILRSRRTNSRAR